MDKVTLALRVRQGIADMGSAALEFAEGNSTLDFYREHRRLEEEKLILYSGALASLVLEEHRSKNGKTLRAVPNKTERTLQS